MIELPLPLKKIKDEIRFKKDKILYEKKYKDHEKKLKKLKNKHKGKRIFIVATGPSINKTNMDLIKNEISIGVNSIYKKYDQFNYYAISDKKVLLNNLSILKIKKPLFLSSDAAKYYFTLNKGNKNIFAMRTKGYMTVTREFSKDPSKYVVGGHTVVIDICLQLAYYMGCKKAYLIGCDSTYDGKKHFDNSKIDNINGKGAKGEWDSVFDAYKICKNAWESDNREIINATVGGKLEIFKRRRLEEIT